MFFRTKMMIAYLCCVCLLGGLFLNNGTALANTPSKKRIAVVSFESQHYEIGSSIADLFVVELFKNKSFEVIERQRIKQVLAEQGFGATGAVSEESAAKLGKILGLDYLVFGSVVGIQGSVTTIPFVGITQHKTTANLTMRLVDATTGKLIFAESAKGDVNRGSFQGVYNDTTLSGAAAEAAAEAVVILVDKINSVNPMEGVITKLSGKMVYIDLGLVHGVQTGQIYGVFSEGVSIVNPKTGKVVGVEKKQIGKIKINNVYEDMSIGEIVDSDDNIREGSVVSRISKSKK